LEAPWKLSDDGDKVTLVGFGSFESRERKAREGRNPKKKKNWRQDGTHNPSSAFFRREVVWRQSCTAENARAN